MNYKKLIKELLKAFTKGADAEEAWDRWLKLGKNDLDKIRELLKSSVRDEFKARAIMVLLVPDFSLLPFAWKDENRKDYVSLKSLEFKSYSEDLKNFVAEFAKLSIDHVLENKLVKFNFNEVILHMLSGLEENNPWALALFEQFSVNDPEPYWNMDFASGYTPFRSLLSDENIPLKWKRLADQKMHDIIIAELEGANKPRKDYEEALKCYTYHIQILNYGGKLGYAHELLVEQFRFLMNTPKIEHYSERQLFDNHHLKSVLSAIKGDEFKGLRHVFARQAVVYVTDENRSFNVYDPSTKRVAEELIAEFGTDEELVAKLSKQISKYKTNQKQQLIKVAETQKEKENVLQNMA